MAALMAPAPREASLESETLRFFGGFSGSFWGSWFRRAKLCGFWGGFKRPFGVHGLGFRVLGPGERGFAVFGFRVQGFWGFEGLGFRSLGLRVWGFGFSGLGFRVFGFCKGSSEG